jgi:GntP family gluconate:H+ symporter
LILLLGMGAVIGLIVGLRLNAFLGLLVAALLVSLLAPGEAAERVARVAEAFGSTAGSIGIVIALAAVIGKAMLDSGAADRIVRTFFHALGEQRAPQALMGGGFVLAVPVFFDTVFFLLVPLARSAFGRTGRHYLRYLMAVAGGAAITHTLVPPTPGPLIVADALAVDLGTMMLVGLVVAVPSAAAGLAFGAWRDRRAPIDLRPEEGGVVETAPPPTDGPGLAASFAPIVLPIALITAHTVVTALAAADGASAVWVQVGAITAIVGNPNLALLAAAAVAVGVLVRQRRPSRAALGEAIEEALMSAGVIILITAAGGAFGAMLRAAEIGPALADLFGGGASGLGLLGLAFGVAALLKTAQGSSTVAMITAGGIVAGLLPVAGAAGLAYHPVYLATAIASGSLVGSWMNDSGFWIYARMGGLTEVEALTTWTPLLVVLGVTGFATTLLLAVLLPLT